MQCLTERHACLYIVINEPLFKFTLTQKTVVDAFESNSGPSKSLFMDQSQPLLSQFTFLPYHAIDGIADKLVKFADVRI